MSLLLLLLVQVLTTVTMVGVHFFILLKVRRFWYTVRTIAQLCSQVMDLDTYLDSLEDDGSVERARSDASIAPAAAARDTDVPPCREENHRARLAAVIAGGQSRELLGKQYSTSYIEGANSGEVEKLYAIYEARVGGQVSRALGQTLIKLYTRFAAHAVAGMGFAIDNTESLADDLGRDPFVSQAISAGCCELYHRFGYLLAPITTAAITASHVEQREQGGIDERRDDGRRTSTDSSAIGTTRGEGQGP